MYYPMFYDPTYILVMIGVVICLLASAKMNSTFSKYSRVHSHSGMTGKEAAEALLHREGIYDVRVEYVAGNLTDHYDPRSKVLRLSDATYQQTSVAAIGVAAHECGHAIQDKENYKPMRIRSKIVPTVNLCTKLGYLAIVIGAIFSYKLMEIGIILLLALLAFQLITLPVEFNASSRALKELKKLKLLDSEEIPNAKSMLSAAAFTYVAAMLSTLLEILRYVLIFTDRDN